MLEHRANERPRLILIAVSEHSELDRLQSLLNVSSCETHVAPNAQNALSKLGENRNLEIVITEFRLPDMTGVEFLKNVRRQVGIEAPAIMLTSTPITATAAIADIQSVEIIRKPVDTRFLRQRVEELTGLAIVHQT